MVGFFKCVPKIPWPSNNIISRRKTVLVGSMFNLANFSLLLPIKILVSNATFKPVDSILHFFLVIFFEHFPVFNITTNVLNLGSVTWEHKCSPTTTGLVWSCWNWTQSWAQTERMFKIHLSLFSYSESQTRIRIPQRLLLQLLGECGGIEQKMMQLFGVLLVTVTSKLRQTHL